MLKSIVPQRTGASSALRRTSSFLAFLLIVLLPFVAWAEPVATATATATAPAPQTALGNFLTALLGIVVPVVLGAIGTLLSWLLWKLKQKTGLDIAKATADQWETIATNAALRAAEWARKQAAATKAKIPGPQVLDTAVNWAITAASSLGLAEKARHELEGLIEAKLFELRRDMEVENTNIAKGPEGGLSVAKASLPTTV